VRPFQIPAFSLAQNHSRFDCTHRLDTPGGGVTVKNAICHVLDSISLFASSPRCIASPPPLSPARLLALLKHIGIGEKSCKYAIVPLLMARAIMGVPEIPRPRLRPLLAAPRERWVHWPESAVLSS